MTTQYSRLLIFLDEVVREHRHIVIFLTKIRCLQIKAHPQNTRIPLSFLLPPIPRHLRLLCPIRQIQT